MHSGAVFYGKDPEMGGLHVRTFRTVLADYT